MAISGSDGSIVLTTKVDTSGLKKGISSVQGDVSALTRGFKNLLSIIGIAFSVKAIVDFSKESAKFYTQTEASVQRLVDIYGDAAQSVGDFIEANARAIGMSKSAGASIAATYGNLLSVWADQATNAQLTNALLNQTAVVASKTGRTTTDVSERIRSGLLGNTEAIEDLGINVNIKTIEITDAFKRIADGRSWEQLDAYEQEQVRTLAILEQSANKYGTTVANTTATVRNQYQAAYEDFKNTWGQVVNIVLVPVLKVLTQLFNVATVGLRSAFGLSKKTISIQENQSESIGVSVENQKQLTDEIEKTQKAAKGALAPFDEIKTLTKNSASNMQIPDIGGVDIGGIVDSKDVEIAEEANESFGFFNKVIEKLKKILKPLQNISFKNLVNSLKNLGSALEPYKEMVWNGLSWLWFDVLSPMAEWTIENLIPAFLDTLSASLEFLTPILEAIQPTLSWFWNEIIVPMASFVGDLFVDFLNLLTEAFTKLSDWAKENPTFIQAIFDIIIGGLAGLWVYNSTKKILDFLENLRYQFKLFAMMDGKFSALGKAINSPASAIGALVAAGLFWVQNWDKIKRSFDGMNAWQKTITIVLGLAAAIAVLWVALSAGVAAAGIVAGLAAIGLGAGIIAMGNANEKAEASKELKTIPSDSVVASSVPTKSIGGYSIPGYAKGTVVPPNKPHLAWFGDNTREPEVVSPVSTMKQAFLEALQVAGGVGTSQDNRPIILQVDGREIARATREGNASLGSQTVFGGFANAY